MVLNEKIKKVLQNDWLIALLLLFFYLIHKGYAYGWDDQHLEIPLLKKLIDPALYPGDYYVESLKVNFCSFLYPLLAKFITIQQIPTTYLVLYLLSRYFFLFWMYKFWYLIASKRDVAFLVVVLSFFMGRITEFYYRTFSHQEFAFAFVMAGIYFFYKERFILASAIFGIGANFHLLYNLFPMSYLGVYLLLPKRPYPFKTILKSFIAFLLCCLPVIIWIVQKGFFVASPHDTPTTLSWLKVYDLASPQNFIFHYITLKDLLTYPLKWIKEMHPFVLLFVVFLFHQIFNPHFQKDQKTRFACLTAIGFLAISYFFTYIRPSRTIVDLNLIRNAQFLSFFLMGYSVVYLCQLTEEKRKVIGYFATIMLGFLCFNNFIAILAIIFMIFLLLNEKILKMKRSYLSISLIIIIILLQCISVIGIIFLMQRIYKTIQIATIIVIIALSILIFLAHRKRMDARIPIFEKGIMFAIMIGLALNMGIYHVKHITLEKSGGGFWALQRDWIDMQKYVHNHTPKDAYLLVPYDMEMGGFRILSERKIIVCYRDCGIVGFDYKAALEWLQRIKDIEGFKVKIDKNDLNLNDALDNAILKYKVGYVVFMRYYAPSASPGVFFEKLYENKNFSLFRVKKEKLPLLFKQY